MSGERAELLLAKSIQAARKKAGLTQQELCQKAKVSYSTLAKIERGAIASPSVFTVANIARICGTSVEELVGEQTSPGSKGGRYKTSPSGIEFIYFDINGCMVQDGQRAFSKIAADYGISGEVIESAFWHFNDAACRGELSAEEFDAAMAQRLGLDSLDWQKYYLDSIEPIEAMQQLLKSLSGHYRIGLISNIMPGLIDMLLAQGSLPDIDYQAIVDSSVEHFIKPDPPIYDTAAKRSAVAAANILLVDDSHVNLMAAERAGWRVMSMDSLNPERTAEALAELLPL